jgi:hypothetical protein
MRWSYFKATVYRARVPQRMDLYVKVATGAVDTYRYKLDARAPDRSGPPPDCP